MANTVSVSAVPFNPNSQSFGSVSPAPQSQAVTNVNANKGVPTAEQNLAAFQATQPKVPTSTNIPVNYVGTQGISVPTQQPPQQQQPVINTAQQIIEATRQEPTEIQKQGDAMSMNRANLYSGLAGQGQYEGQKLEEFGYNKFKQQQNDLNSQILQKTAELNQDDVKLAASLNDIEKQAIPMNFITGQQQSVARDAQIARALKSSEIGVLNAVAIGTQGNIALAQEFATNAVAQKYAPIKEAIMIQEAQLQAIQPILTREEKKQAQEQQIKMTVALQEVEAKQKQAQSITSMIVGASQYAPASVITNAMNLQKQGADEVTVARSLGEYGGDYLKNQLLKSQLVTEKAQQQKIYTDIAAKKEEMLGSTSSLYNIQPGKFKDAAARTAYTTAGGVISAVDTLLGTAKEGNFPGLGYFQGVTPEYTLSKEGQQNRGFLGGVEVKVQQWASGASLTESQIKLVQKMVPKQADADSVVKSKLDSLKKYMENEQSSIASSQGQRIVTPDQINNNYANGVDKAYSNALKQTTSIPSSSDKYSSFYNSLYAK